MSNPFKIIITKESNKSNVIQYTVEYEENNLKVTKGFSGLKGIIYFLEHFYSEES